MKEQYRPISCSAYDVLESASVLGHRVELALADGSTAVGRITDVFSKGPEEFCSLKEAGSGTLRTIRLDTVLLITDQTDNKTYTTNAC